MHAARLAFWALLLCSDASAHRGGGFDDFEESDPPLADEENPPHWPSSVHVFSPEDQDSISITDVIAELTEDLNNVTTGHFSDRRVALLFRPGVYENVTVQVGYYTQVLGLGLRADDTVFTNTTQGIYAPADERKPSPGSLDNFWRSAENFRNEPSEGMVWSVSQAAPIRRVHVAGNLTTNEAGAWASGGFLANVLVDGHTDMGGQQQWMSRNSDLGSPSRSMWNGNWNLVFVGCTGAPAPRYPVNNSGGVGIINKAATPVIAEKPFITIDAEGKYSLQVPAVKWDSVGSNVNMLPDESGTLTVPFEQVFVANATGNTVNISATIQAKLNQRRHVVLSPGIYHLTETLTLNFPGQVLLGIGMATLHPPPDGSPCVRVSPGVADVRVAGLMLGASKVSRPDGGVTTLLEWGSPTSTAKSNPQQPGVLSDIFARVGGPDTDRAVGVDKMIRIFSSNVVGDNLWLWRADHALLDPDEPPQDDIDDSKKNDYHLVEKGEYPCEAGLEVLGNHVIMYGLFVEHTLGNMTQWRGNAGQVYFYQSELPYDVNQTYYGDVGYAGYTVADDVVSHQAYGMGVYTYFRDHTVNVHSGILAPAADGVRFTNSFTRFLNGHGGIDHVLSGQGGRAEEEGTRMARLASSLGDEDPETCPDVPEEIKRENTVLIVIVVILVIILLLTALYAYFLRASVLKRSMSTLDGGGSPQNADNARNQQTAGGISMS